MIFIKRMLGFLGLAKYCSLCGLQLVYTRSTWDKYYIETQWFACPNCDPGEFSNETINSR